MKNKVVGGLRRFTRWLFSSPFRNLPPGLEEHAPELELFEAEMEDMQQHTQQFAGIGRISPTS